MSKVSKPIKFKKFVTPIILFLILMVVATFGYIIENFSFIMEESAVMSLKPVKHKVDKKLIKLNLCYDKKNCNERTLTLFLQKRSLARAKSAVDKPATMIIVHGGFWAGGISKNYFHIAGMAHRAGFNVIVANTPKVYGIISRNILPESWLSKYRFEAQMKSMVKIINFINSYQVKYGLSQKIYVTTAGSGSQLFLSAYHYLFNKSQKSKIQSLTMLSPVLDITQVKKEIYDRFIVPAFGPKSEVLRKYSPVYFLKKINFNLLLIQPERNFPFMKKGNQEFIDLIKEKKIKTNKVFQEYTSKIKSHRTLIFRIGRKIEKFTGLTLSFWKKK